jgi:hypothetical protein
MKSVLGLSSIIAAIAFAGCVAVPITPNKLAVLAATDPTARSELDTWTSAVAIANEFLHSNYRHTLPEGVITMDGEGMIFMSDKVELHTQVRATSFGNFMVHLGFAGQTRSWGFVVGKVPPRKDYLTDNSLFRDLKGNPYGNVFVAKMILHELTHMNLGMGMDKPTVMLRAYSEAILLCRYRNHSMERLAWKTSAEFDAYINTFRKEHPECFPLKTPEPNPAPEPTTLYVAPSSSRPIFGVALL